MSYGELIKNLIELELDYFTVQVDVKMNPIKEGWHYDEINKILVLDYSLAERVNYTGNIEPAREMIFDNQFTYFLSYDDNKKKWMMDYKE